MRCLPLVALVGLPACWLEKVTGEPVPLDPDFYASVEASQGQPGVGGGSSVPFHDHDGERVVVRGTITGELEDPIDIDIRTPDATKEGGVQGHGKILLDEPGVFEISVPKGLGAMELQAFQDAGGDGPTSDDPFAQASVIVADVDVEGVVMELQVGAHGVGGPVHNEAAPGAPGGGPGGGAGGIGPDPFVEYPGPRVTLRGTLTGGDGQSIDLDVFKPDENSTGGRLMLGKLMRAPGPYEIQVPANFGPLILEAFIDVQKNGPGAGDPMGRYENNPVQIGEDDIDGIDIALTVPEDGRMPMGEPAPPPAEGPELQ